MTPDLVARAAGYDGRLVWFSLESANRVVARHTESGGTAFVLADNELHQLSGSACTAYCDAAAIPIALGGAARHNLANALAASALCDSLGMSLDAIRDGLCSMSQHDNPGRCNVYQLPQCTVLVDFAHNPHAMKALFDMAQALPARRRLLAFSQAGDRTDAQIRQLATSAWSIGLDRVVVSELAKYHRGRANGEVFGLIRAALLAAGARDDQIEYHEQEIESLDACLSHAGPGDLIIMLALGDSARIRQRLECLSGHPS
ncbi:MAG: cyanophycin synthetase [Woeseiaceae bacterium]|nr:cyanophycin synthetase [Woeseiaceae bacterium]